MHPTFPTEGKCKERTCMSGAHRTLWVCWTFPSAVTPWAVTRRPAGLLEHAIVWKCMGQRAAVQK